MYALVKRCLLLKNNLCLAARNLRNVYHGSRLQYFKYISSEFQYVCPYYVAKQKNLSRIVLKKFFRTRLARHVLPVKGRPK